MKPLIYLLSRIVFIIGSYVCALWAVIEFIIYLVKDIPFNFWSLKLLILCIIISIVLWIKDTALEAQ